MLLGHATTRFVIQQIHQILHDSQINGDGDGDKWNMTEEDMLKRTTGWGKK
jgi:hypothetical protein